MCIKKKNKKTNKPSIKIKSIQLNRKIGTPKVLESPDRVVYFRLKTLFQTNIFGLLDRLIEKPMDAMKTQSTTNRCNPNKIKMNRIFEQDRTYH